MDEKVLKMVSWMSVFLTVVICVSLYFFPALHERSVLAAETKAKLSMDGLAPVNVIAKEENPEVIVAEEETWDGQLKIEIPEGIEKKDIQLVNDYITQTLFIKIKNGVEDYFSQYRISGSSDHIASLYYYKDNEEGVIALGLDKVYEVDNDIKDGQLCLDFIDPHDIYDKVVVIDAGHGSRAAGAVKMGYLEKNINLNMVLELKKLLDKTDEKIGVYYTRTEDSNPTLDQRVQLANRVNADLFISIHNNASSSGNFSDLRGTQVLYSESDKSGRSKKLADICLSNALRELGSVDQGLVKGDRIYIIRTSKVPVALVEIGFMTNRGELENLVSENYQEKVAKAIYNSIFEAFEEGY